MHLTHLRRTLAPISTCRLATRTPGYVLEDDGLDSLEFERLVRSAADARQRGQPDAALPLLVEALGLWSGPAFDDLRGAAPVDDEAIRLERLRSDAAEEQIACLLDLGSPEQAIQPVAALRQAEPLRERPVELQMLALYRVGRAPDAWPRINGRERSSASSVSNPRQHCACSRAMSSDTSRPCSISARLSDTTCPRSCSPVPRREDLPSSEDAKGPPFVGRDAIRTRIGIPTTSRLVTILGPAGIGKTRLATLLAWAATDGGAPIVIRFGAPGTAAFATLLAGMVPDARRRTGRYGASHEDCRRRRNDRRCARSWKILPEVGSDPDYPDLSLRDAAAMREFDPRAQAAE